jgi:hypothetical protein
MKLFIFNLIVYLTFGYFFGFTLGLGVSLMYLLMIATIRLWSTYP